MEIPLGGQNANMERRGRLQRGRQKAVPGYRSLDFRISPILRVRTTPGRGQGLDPSLRSGWIDRWRDQSTLAPDALMTGASRRSSAAR
jgi:hypothetical protein